MNTEHLFSYGTLQLESVQLAKFGRRLSGSPDALPGYEQSLVRIQDAAVVAARGKTHHPIAKFTGRETDLVHGTVFQVSSEELQHADRYEVADYTRVSVILRSGIRAWVYVDTRELIGGKGWAPST